MYAFNTWSWLKCQLKPFTAPTTHTQRTHNIILSSLEKLRTYCITSTLCNLIPHLSQRLLFSPSFGSVVFACTDRMWIYSQNLVHLYEFVMIEIIHFILLFCSFHSFKLYLPYNTQYGFLHVFRISRVVFVYLSFDVTRKNCCLNVSFQQCCNCYGCFLCISPPFSLPLQLSFLADWERERKKGKSHHFSNENWFDNCKHTEAL